MRSDFLSKKRRQAIYKRDGYACLWCAKNCDRDDRTLDHIVPRAHGGTHHSRNLITACRACNSIRRHRSLYCFAQRFAHSHTIVMRILEHAERPIFHAPRIGARGQLTLVMAEGSHR